VHRTASRKWLLHKGRRQDWMARSYISSKLSSGSLVVSVLLSAIVLSQCAAAAAVDAMQGLPD
jgi:hypothetical protein